jgi:DNA-directed RNA polymerase subunit RPC12/RpoP
MNVEQTNKHKTSRCSPVTWEQYDGTTVYKCMNVDDAIVTYDAKRFVYCPLCGGRIEVDDD